MRLLVFFDLPNVERKDKREYRRFLKFLTGEGFIMMQESLYCKLLTNYGAASLELEKVRKNKTKDGLIQAMVITEKQYEDIEYIIGEKNFEKMDSLERVLVL